MSRVTWIAEWPATEAGHEGPIVIRDIDGASGGRIICVVPGNRVHHRGDGRVVAVLDEYDAAAARLILAAPRMRRVLEVLRLWHVRMGDWRPAIWEEAEALLDELARDCRAQYRAGS